MKKYILSLIFVMVIIPFAFAGIEIVGVTSNTSDSSKVINLVPIPSTFNNNTGSVNSSDYWDALDTPSDINLDDLGSHDLTYPNIFNFIGSGINTYNNPFLTFNTGVENTTGLMGLDTTGNGFVDKRFYFDRWNSAWSFIENLRTYEDFFVSGDSEFTGNLTVLSDSRTNYRDGSQYISSPSANNLELTAHPAFGTITLNSAIISLEGIALAMGMTTFPSTGMSFQTSGTTGVLSYNGVTSLFNFNEDLLLNKDLTVQDNSTFQENVQIDGDLNVSGNAVANNNLTVGGELISENDCGIPSATESFEGRVIVSNVALGLGSGQTSYGMPQACNGTVTAFAGVGTGSIGTSLDLVVRKNNVATSCVIDLTTTVGLANSTSCSVSFNKNDVIGVYAGTEVGAWTEVVGSIWMRYE